MWIIRLSKPSLIETSESPRLGQKEGLNTLALIEVNLSVQRIAEALERIAGALERISPPIPLRRLSTGSKRGPDAIIKYGDNENEWMRQEFTNLVREQGLAPSQEAELIRKMMADAQLEENNDEGS
jgi:hypothetical protein